MLVFEEKDGRAGSGDGAQARTAAASVGAVPMDDIVLANVSSAYAALSQLIGGGRSIALPGLDALITVTLAQEGATAERVDVMALAGPMGRAELYDATRFLRALTGIDCGSTEDVPDEEWIWLQSVLVRRLATGPLAGVDRIDRASTASFDDPVFVRVTLASPGHVLGTWLRSDARTLQHLLSAPGWKRQQAQADRFSSLVIERAVPVARHTLPAAVLATLAPGDVIVPDQPSFDLMGNGVISLGGIRARIRHVWPGLLEVTGVERGPPPRLSSRPQVALPAEGRTPRASRPEAGANTEEQRVGEDKKEIPDGSRSGENQGEQDKGASRKPEAPAPQSHDLVPVVLQFEMGRFQATLGQLRSMAAGTILPIHGGAPDAVAIVASGHRLGRGELVSVDGKLGIRIVEWGHAGDEHE